MNKNNLDEFFKLSELDITEIRNEPKLLSLLVLYQYHPIWLWFDINKTRKRKIYKKLLQYKEEIKNLEDLHDIPFDMEAKYISRLEPRCHIIKSSDITITSDVIINNIKDKSNAIYIYNESKHFIIFRFYDNTCILIDVDTLNIIQSNNIESILNQLNMIIKDYKYQLVNILYTPAHYIEE
jgi:hypothetical protein